MKRATQRRDSKFSQFHPIIPLGMLACLVLGLTPRVWAGHHASADAASAGGAGPPVVWTGPATVISPHSARLTGTVNPNGVLSYATNIFQWGTTTNYGNYVGAGIHHGVDPQPVEAYLWNLPVSTTFHYRFVSFNEWGGSFGEDRTFETPAAMVTNCTDANLRAALARGGTVTFLCDGVIALTNTININTNTVLDATGHAIVISGSNAVRLFVARYDVAFTLKHLALADGFAAGADATTSGYDGGAGFGGALTTGGTLIAVDCNFVRNRAAGGHGPINYPNRGGAGAGGAIYGGGDIRLTNVTFFGNEAQGGRGGTSLGGDPAQGGSGGDSLGGAIHMGWGFFTADNVRFEANRARPGEPGLGPTLGTSGSAVGGALYFGTCWVQIATCRFTSNLSGFGTRGGTARGGAIFQYGSTLQMVNTLLDGNQVVGGAGDTEQGPYSSGIGQGGALYRSGAPATIVGCTFVNNVAQGGPAGTGYRAGSGYGGGIYANAYSRVTNSTFCGNAALGGEPALWPGDAFGGGIYVEFGDANLCHLTLANNLARHSQGGDPQASPLAQGGGICAANEVALVHLKNCILAYSPSGSNAYGRVYDEGGNISSDATPVLTALGSRNNTDPLLGLLADYGGPTPTMALLAGSPAIDAGDNAACTPTDQRGVRRPQHAGCDIGAYEVTWLAIRSLNGEIRIEQVGVPDSPCTLQSSANLRDWTNVETRVADADGRVIFLLTKPADVLGQFYRTVVP